MTAEIGEGFIYIPAGPFIQGGDPEAVLRSLPRSEPHVDELRDRRASRDDAGVPRVPERAGRVRGAGGGQEAWSGSFTPVLRRIC